MQSVWRRAGEEIQICESIRVQVIEVDRDEVLLGIASQLPQPSYREVWLKLPADSEIPNEKLHELLTAR